MSASISAPDERISTWSPMRERMWWLPRRGIGNGLDAAGWAPILDVDPAGVGDLLDALGRRGIAAFAGRAAPGAAALTSGAVTSGAVRSDSVTSDSVTLWVATERWSAAEDLLMARLRGPRRRDAVRRR